MRTSIKRVLGLSAISLIVVPACSMAGSNYRPIIDAKGVDLNRYEADLADCQSYARQASGAGKSAVGGAAAGGAVGVVGSAISGGNVAKSAGMGALIGGLLGAGAGETAQREIIQKCLAGRGYKVLQ